MIYKLHFI